jgi:hypothetical protein
VTGKVQQFVLDLVAHVTGKVQQFVLDLVAVSSLQQHKFTSLVMLYLPQFSILRLCNLDIK